MGEHRWQGYGHPELFEQIHQGPGPDASTESARRWTELTRALGDVDAGLASALAAAMSGWQGEAAEGARSGLRPLGDWAEQARQAAATMRERAEQQAEFVGKARADMPPPVPATSEQPNAVESLLTHLFGGQTDYEQQEARQDAAEQRAFEVMRTYESSTETNTTALASFTPAPQVIVDAPTARTGGSGGVAQQPVTISWASAPLPRATPESAPLRGSAAGGPARSSGTAARSAPAAGRPVRSAHEPDEPVDRNVTERLGDDGGFFDEPRTPARPVIGGDPGR